ncbi:DUF6090 family protein [Algoriphagus boseongensis]|uniref:DUF6090 family protein n=1 Tax=Algoriphagus boseongensis TaxID=1442587 RepID=UPI00106106EC|nr:DUF6090 family protein [Algoriphagus boseongensis]
MLVQNKITRYLAYALGEIALVMIGILLALQVNTWNDQKKSEAAELAYYCRILDDFKLDQQLIDERIQLANERIATSRELLQELDAGTQDKTNLLNKFLLAIRGEAYVPRNATYKDLISSGNLKLLQDIEIKNSLIQFYAEQENKQVQLKQNRDEVIQEIFKMLNDSPDFGGLQEYDYVQKQLGSELIATLPNVDWTKDKNNVHYRKFQQVILFNLTMAEREKQHLATIHQLMEAPFQLLSEKCKGGTNQ